MNQGNIPIPSIARSSEDIERVRDYMTLIKGAEDRGVFYCKACEAKLTDIAGTLPNDGLDHVRPCPRCGVPLLFNAGWLAVKVLEAQQLERHGLGPVEPGKGGQIEERALPDGRKLIIARPGPAEIRAFSAGPGRKT